jgi:carbon monoxide dehydrogenase subunit G
MRQEFHKTVSVDAPVGAVWSAVGDVREVLGWISIVEAVHEVEAGNRYTVVLADKLGPFKLRADVDVAVQERLEGKRIVARGDGEDRQIGSRLTIEVALDLASTETGTAIDVRGSYEVTGRPASLGAAAIRKKAQKILDEFFARAALVAT